MLRYAIALTVAPCAAFAQDVDCDHQLTQLDMNTCSYQEWVTADAELNSVYAAAITIVQMRDREYAPEGASEEDRLRIAQRAWVAFREAQCDVAGFQMRGGSAEALLINSCMRMMTQERIAALQGLAAEF